MSTISQRIPNLLLGVSQQPDKLKFPGQVTEASNVFPDYALGLLKRPGGKFESELLNGTARGRWFSILRDDNEKYVGQYDNVDGQFRIWSLIDGKPRAVDMGTTAATGNPAGCNFTTAGPVWSTTVLAEDSSSQNATTVANMFDGSTATFCTPLNVSTSLTIDWDVTTAVPYQTLEVYVGNGVTVINYKGTQISTNNVEGWYTIDNSAGTLDNNNNILLTDNSVPLVGPSIAAIRINKQTILIDADTNWFQKELNGLNARKTVTATELNDLNIAQGDFSASNNNQSTTKQSLFDVNVTYKNGYYEETLASGVLERIDNGQRIIKDATANPTQVAVVAKGAAMPQNYALGNDRTTDYPWFKRDGYRVYEVEKTIPAASDANELAQATADMNTAQAAYDDAVTEEAASKTLYDAKVTACQIGAANIPATAYLKDADPEDIEILTVNDFTFVLNKNKTTAMKTSRSPATVNEAFVVIKTVGYSANYTVRINGLDVTYQTPSSTSGQVLDSTLIAFNIANQINNATSGLLVNFTANIVGPGFHLSGNQGFVIETRGSGTEEGLIAFQQEISTASRLPNQCKDGYIVKVVNSDDVNADDVYVKFKTANSGAFGVGVWEETVGPNLEFEIDETTMPHQLVREANGAFKYEPIDWRDREVGDDTTNPIPSFIGKKIQNMFFYRNRLGMLSNEGVIMSRAGDYYNFFANSAQVVAADDPIDLQATSIRPVTLNYTLSTSVGLLVFGPNEQFLMSSDADVLSPTTTKINTLSTFECDPLVDAVAVGTVQAFISKSNLYTKLFMMLNVQKDAAASIDEATANVPEYIPSSIDSLTSSPAMAITSLGTKGSDTIYQHRFFVQGEDRIQTWYKWKLTGNLQLQFFDKTTFYAVTTSGSSVYLTSYDLTQASESGYLTLPTGERTDVCMDMFNINPERSYSDVTKKTTVELPFTHVAGKKLAVLIIGTYIGDEIAATAESEGSVLYFEDADITNNSVALDGDYRGRDLVIGYVYDMSVELPVFYTTQTEGRRSIADHTADLILHRIKVSTGLSGPITYNVDITGRDAWQNVVNVTLPSTYVLNNVNLSASAVHDIPIYQRNENLKITIVGDTPFPVSLLNIVWEGNYNRRFYQRS